MFWFQLLTINSSQLSKYATKGHFIILALIVLSSSVPLFISSVKRRKRNTFPELFPFENTLKIMSNPEVIWDTILKMHIHMQGLGKKNWELNLFMTPVYSYTNDVENVKHILSNPYIYVKGPDFFVRFKELLGNGIFNSDGAQWLAHRKISSKLFSLNKFKTRFLRTFNEHCDILEEVIRSRGEIIHSVRVSDGTGRADGLPGEVSHATVLDIQELLYRFTLDTIAQTAFGQSLGGLQSSGSGFGSAFDYCQECIFHSYVDPFWRIKRWFTPYGWRFYYCIWQIRSFVRQIVSAKCAEIKSRHATLLHHHSNNGTTGDTATAAAASSDNCDLLSLYLQSETITDVAAAAAPPTTTSSSSPSPSSSVVSALDEGMLCDVVMNMILAGRDTTAVAISWSLFRLCIHPDIQNRVRESILLAVNQPAVKENPSHLTYEELQKMRYLEAFCMEVLRLHPSVPSNLKRVTQDDVWPDGTVVKKGDNVGYQPWVMGRLDSVWENAMEFKPDRFFDVKVSPFQFNAFQAGPRICLGQGSAMLQMKCVLARLLLLFDIELAQPPSTVTYKVSITLPIAGGLKLKFVPRSSLS